MVYITQHRAICELENIIRVDVERVVNECYTLYHVNGRKLRVEETVTFSFFYALNFFFHGLAWLINKIFWFIFPPFKINSVCHVRYFAKILQNKCFFFVSMQTNRFSISECQPNIDRLVRWTYALYRLSTHIINCNRIK